MKNAKKLLAALLAAVMAIGVLAGAALADEPDDEVIAAAPATGTVTIKNAMAGVTYELYRVFDIDGVTEDGKKSSFVTNDKWDAVVREISNGFYTVSGSGVGGIIIPAEDFTSNTKAQEFAKTVLDAGTDIQPEATEKITTSGTHTISGLTYGFYVVKSSRANENPQYTVFTLNKAAVEIDEKNPVYPQIDKLVDGQKTISTDFNDRFTYTITIKAAAGTDTYTITDTMPVCIKYVANSLKLQKKVGGVTSDLERDTNYTVTQENDDIVALTLSADLRNSLTDGDEIIITYQADLAPNENTLNAYTNTAKLTYETDREISSRAAVFSGHIGFYKVDGHTNSNLAGAQFIVKNDQGQYAVLEGEGLSYSFKEWTNAQDKATVITTVNSSTIHTIRGFKAGTYTLVEISAPDGYVKADDTDIKIEEIRNDLGYITGLSSASATIINNPGSQLPDTGGVGTTLFYAAGAALILCAGVLAVCKRRKKA